MGIIHAIIMGLIQGLTEFLPISSSGHLYLASEFMGIKDPGAGFTAVIQMGTLVAVFIYFWQDIANITQGWFRGLFNGERQSEEWKLGTGILAGTVPIVILGLAFEDQIDTTLRTPWVIIAALAFFAIVLGLAEKFSKPYRKLDSFNVADGIVIGIWQAMALVPGSSRSGCTITGGLFSRFERATAARISFLLSIPSILGSGIYKLITEREQLLVGGLTETIIATLVAFISGYAAIAFLMNFLRSNSTWVFVIYRLILAAALALLVLTVGFS